MQVEVEQNLKRGVYRQGEEQILIVNWDSEHPCPPRSEWHYCGRCDFAHPLGGHLYILLTYQLVFALDEIAGELVRLGAIGAVKR